MKSIEGRIKRCKMCEKKFLCSSKLELKRRWFCTGLCEKEYFDNLLCTQCGKKIETSSTVVKFCSKACRTRFYAERRGEQQKTNGSMWRDALLSIFDYECQLCSSKDNLELHHKIPLSRGGNNHITNITCLCSKCHDAVHFNRLVHLSMIKSP